MKADIAINVNCPKCGDIMHRYNTENVTMCQNPRCDLYGKPFKCPTVELVEVKDTNTRIMMRARNLLCASLDGEIKEEMTKQCIDEIDNLFRGKYT